MTEVLIVEDSKIVRNSIEARLKASGRYAVAASIENAANAELVCMSGRVRLVLMDICTADGESGLTAAARIKNSYPDILVVLMTSMPEHSFLERAREAGVDSFWYKEYGSVELLELLDRTVAGESVWPEEQPIITVGLTDSRHITGREMDILRELATGARYEEIAESMNITVNTVKYHVKNLMQKTGFRSTVQLVAEVVEKRLVLPRY